MQQLRDFWKEGHLCDVVLKSIDGIEHPVHRNVLSAASAALKALLCAPFREAEQIRQGKPIEMAASGGVVGAFVDYIYGGEPDVATMDAVELLRLAGAYGLPCLAEAVEVRFESFFGQSAGATVAAGNRNLGNARLKMGLWRASRQGFSTMRTGG